MASADTITASQRVTKLVLIIDDHTDTRELYSDFLAFVGYRVRCAASAEEGIALARTERPHAVVMDLGLPDMDGIEATRVIKADWETAHVSVLIVTGQGTHGYKERALAAGAAGFFQKPFDPDALRGALDRVLFSP